MLIGQGSPDEHLSETRIRGLMAEAIERADLSGKRVLVIVPDSTRSGPMPLLFRLLNELLGRRASALDFLIALGTHQPMSDQAIEAWLELRPGELAGRFQGVRVLNHRWMDPGTFHDLGVMAEEEIERISQGLLRLRVPVAVNRLVLDYDQLIVCGPVFPHEVAGFSGGNKYFFPGIGGQEFIDFTHWLGALITCCRIIGVKYTPVRRAIDRAAAMIKVKKLAVCYVVAGKGLAGMFTGPPEQAWSRAVDLSAQVHVRCLDRPVRRVLSVMPRMYDDIWVAAKGMYKLEPVVTDGGEVIIHAPHITEISHTHGRVIERIGYHVRDYFTAQWDRFRHEPWGVLAHSTHLRGLGTYEDGQERPRIRVSLATGIDPERCRRVNLGYRDPASIDPDDWAKQQDEDLLVVPEAGEILHRLKGDSS